MGSIQSILFADTIPFQWRFLNSVFNTEIKLIFNNTLKHIRKLSVINSVCWYLYTQKRQLYGTIFYSEKKVHASGEIDLMAFLERVLVRTMKMTISVLKFMQMSIDAISKATAKENSAENKNEEK